jgi:F0F1-type ATP synthase membrane subunit c/vacuolar-type H+-ATPase subunit K
MDGSEVLIPLAGIGMIIAIVLGPAYLKSRERREIQETVRTAIDKGQPLPPEMIDAMTRDVAKTLPSRTRDIRRGIIWLAVGVGIAAFSYLSAVGWHDNDAGEFFGGMTGVAAIPVTIGLAFLVLSFFNKNKD